MIYDEQIMFECTALEESIAKKKAFLSKAPDGRLECHKSKGYYNWVVVSKNKEGKKQAKYLKKDKRKTAEKLALKGLYICELRDEEAELRALQSYLRNKSKFERGKAYITKSEEHYNLLKSHIDQKFDEEIENWLDTEPQEMAPKPEMRKFRCKNGMVVRSKSEQIIATALFDKGIPFKYEYPLHLSNKTFFPDFTIKNPRTKKIIIWEHFGMMDNEDYGNNCYEKLKYYNKNGYRPFINIITTFEDKETGINEQWINEIINQFCK